jgi:hypothetical protein
MLDKEKLAKMRWMNPCATLQELSDSFGVTRERIRQVLNELELPTKHYSEKKMVSCLQCGSPIKEGKEFCNLKCQNAYNTILITCSQCGKLMERKACQTLLTESRMKLGYKGNFFCSKRCQGFWLAEKHGYGVDGEITLNCLHCRKEFHIPMSMYRARSKKGQDLFCDRECFRDYWKQNKKKRGRITVEKNEMGQCGHCGKSFLSHGLRQRIQNSKSHRIFCSLNCSNQYKRAKK